MRLEGEAQHHAIFARPFGELHSVRRPGERVEQQGLARAAKRHVNLRARIAAVVNQKVHVRAADSAVLRVNVRAVAVEVAETKRPQKTRQ